jgi:hypothetical protein
MQQAASIWNVDLLSAPSWRTFRADWPTGRPDRRSSTPNPLPDNPQTCPTTRGALHCLITLKLVQQPGEHYRLRQRNFNMELQSDESLHTRFSEEPSII